MFVPSGASALLNRVLPKRLIRALHRVYDPYHHWAVQRLSKQLIPRIFPDGRLEVKQGPFAGMSYLPQSGGSALVPKLLGSYELELNPAFIKVLGRGYRLAVDIGCAEGYYTVGLAFRLPGTVVYGFDLDPESLKACRRLAELNRVANRVRLEGEATVENLSSIIGSRALIISDCEGAEVELLDPVKIPGLKQADMIVELHDRIVPGASELIARRFRDTHTVTLIPSTERNPADFPLLKSLSPKEQRQALDEFRGGPMEWAFLEAKTNPS